MTEILIALLCLAGIGAFVWFFVLHKHVSAIHAKVDSILHAVSPGGSAASLPSPSKPQPSPSKASGSLTSVLSGPPKPLT